MLLYITNRGYIGPLSVSGGPYLYFCWESRELVDVVKRL